MTVDGWIVSQAPVFAARCRRRACKTGPPPVQPSVPPPPDYVRVSLWPSDKNCSYDLTHFIFLSTKIHCMSHTYHYLYYFTFSFSIIWFEKRIFHATAHCCHSSRRWQHAIIVCLVCCMTTVVKLRGYIVSINLLYIINRLLGHNI